MIKIWAYRKCVFDSGFSIYPKFIERLNGIPIILESLIASIPVELHKINLDKEWSIQENVGHQIGVHDLFTRRLEDYESGAESLRPEDMSGSSTN